MAFGTSIIGDVHVLTPTSNLVGGDETESLKAAVAKLAAVGGPKVVVNLGKVSWVSSLGLAGLIRARNYCVEQQGWFRLACVGKRSESVVMRFKFDTFESVDDAVSGQVRDSSGA